MIEVLLLELVQAASGLPKVAGGEVRPEEQRHPPQQHRDGSLRAPSVPHLVESHKAVSHRDERLSARQTGRPMLTLQLGSGDG